MTTFYVNGLCGGTKTYNAIRHAHYLAQLGKKILLVQPSIFLISETIKDLSSLTPDVRCRAIHGETSSKVIADIIDHLKHTASGGEILFITHSALMLLPYFHRRQDWHVIVDEIPQADWCAEFNVPNTHRLITDHFTIDPTARNLADNRYVRAIAGNRPVLEEIAKNAERDQVWDIFQKFAHILLSQHWSAYVLDDQYTNLMNSNGQNRKLLAFAHLKPSLLDGFATVIIMGACFEESILYQLWTSMGAKFRRHKAITKQLRFKQHANGHLLTIRYAIEDDWSKTLRNKRILPDDPTTVFDRVVQRVAETFSDTQFVWMGNKDVPDGVFNGRGHRLPNSPHGLNLYQHIHNSVVLSALNPPPAHFSFLDALGLRSEDVKRAGYWQAVYQAIMRTSPRNPNDMNPKTVIVMDRATAEWLATMFPGCTVEPLDGMGDMPMKGKSGRPRKHDCDADKKREYRNRFKVELQGALDLVNGTDEVVGRFPGLAAELREQMSEFRFGADTILTTMGRGDLNALGGTVYASIYHTKPLDFFPHDDTEAFIDGLRFFHSSAWENKPDNGLVSPAIFDPSLSDETSRGLANIRAIRGVWLDNDGGDLSPDEFARLFPRLRMVIFNSYSCGPNKNKWRAFIPTTIAMSIAAYRAITGQIMRTLNRAGYWSQKQLDTNPRIKSRKHHGFDMGKLTPSSLFYLPCQAQNPANSFFLDFNDGNHAASASSGDGRAASQIAEGNLSRNRAPLDPYVWAGYAANHARPPETVEIVETVPPQQPVRQPMPETSDRKLHVVRKLMRDEVEDAAGQIAARHQAAIDKWHSAGPGNGNAAFFQLGVDLRKTGMSSTEIRAMLAQEANNARHPRERRDQVKHVMRTLARPWRMAA